MPENLKNLTSLKKRTGTILLFIEDDDNPEEYMKRLIQTEVFLNTEVNRILMEKFKINIHVTL